MNEEDTLKHFGVRGMKWGVRKNHQDAADKISTTLVSPTDNSKHAKQVRSGIRTDLTNNVGKDRVRVVGVSPRINTKSGEHAVAAIVESYGKSKLTKRQILVAYSAKNAIAIDEKRKADKRVARKEFAAAYGKQTVMRVVLVSGIIAIRTFQNIARETTGVDLPESGYNTPREVV